PRLAGLPLLDLHGDRARPPVQTFRGAYVDFRQPRARTEELTAFAQGLGASPFMALYAAFSSLLGRYSGQDDFAVGAYIANRTRAEIEPLIGFFVNNLVLRADLAGAPDASELLGRVRETTVGAYAHQELPFEKLVAELQPERDLSRAPLVQAMLNFLNFPAVHEELPDLTLSGSGVRNDWANFDLTLWVAESADGLTGWLDYNTDLFDRATAERLAGHLARLLAGMVGSPDRPVRELPLLSASESAELAAWGVRRGETPAVRVVHRSIERQVAATPEATALAFFEERFTYRELNATANRLARWLVGQGIGLEARVGLAVERTPRLLIAVLAILKAGGAYVPLDPTHPRERLEKILEDARPSLLLTEEPLRAALPESGARTILFDSAEVRAGVGAEDGSDLSRPVFAESLAYVLFTSGSTGRPKGVQVAHGSLVNFLVSMQAEPGLAAGESVLAITTLSFDIAGLELLLPLTVGARVELATTDEARDGLALQARLRSSGADVLQATPATWRMLLDSGWTGERSLRALSGGEALPVELAERLLARTGALWNLYGPTETTVWSAAREIRAVPRGGTVPIGGPTAHTELLLLDAALGAVPRGVPGEICIGGAGVARGYYGRPDLTAERFVPHPQAAGERLYRTGDLALWRADGALEFLGRSDHQVKVRGFRIELGEVEAALLVNDAVRAGAVVVSEERGEKRLVAYMVPQAGTALPVVAALAFLRERLPGYMVPSYVVAVSELPL
ncbi:MAG TPA: amino acid adenylation domain-containing protein, partial [Thermoanaerobaculia bacterium]